MDKYHPGYFGKVGMRHFHLTRNQYWRPVINIDKLWTLVPVTEREGLTEDSEVVPVIDTLQHGYGKVLGKGRLPKLPFIVKARFVSAKAECVRSRPWDVCADELQGEDKRGRRRRVAHRMSCAVVALALLCDVV